MHVCVDVCACMCVWMCVHACVCGMCVCMCVCALCVHYSVILVAYSLICIHHIAVYKKIPSSQGNTQPCKDGILSVCGCRM